MPFLTPCVQAPNDSASDWSILDARSSISFASARAVGEPPHPDDGAPYTLAARRVAAGPPAAGRAVARPPGRRTDVQRMPDLTGIAGPELVARAMHRVELRSNRLLAAMTGADRSQLEPRMRSAYVEAGTSLFEMGTVLPEVYFPVTAVISLCHVTGNGQAATVGLIGDEGMAGLDCVMGAPRCAYRAVVSQPGRVIAARTHAMASQVGASAELRRILLGYAWACYAEAARALVCVQRHSLEQRLCGRLLLLAERSRSTDLWASHEYLGEMLGVRRETVTDVAGCMRRRGYIDYRRGRLRLLNPLALSALACDCHAPIKDGALAASDACDDRPEASRSASVGGARRHACEATTPA